MNHLVHLRTFLAVYRLGSVTKAAAQLGLTQPAASGHLKALDAQMRRPLFRREGRGIAPTSAAHTLARTVGPYLDGLEGAFAAATLRSDSLVGTVHLGGPVEFMTERVLPALAHLPDLGIRLQVTFGVVQDLVGRLESGEIDLAVATVRISRGGIGYETLFREEFVLVGAPKWQALLPARGDGRVDVAELADLPWLAYAQDLPVVRRYFRKVFGQEPGFEAAQVIPNLRALMTACAGGAGLTVLPRYMCQPLIETGSLVMIDAPPEPPVNEIFLGWNKLGLRHPRNALLRKALLEAAGW